MKVKKCIVTDMDQVICCSQQIHGEIESRILSTYGIHVSASKIACEFSGVGTEYLFRQYLSGECVGHALHEKEKYLSQITHKDIHEISGAKEFYRSAQSKFDMAVGSGSSIAFINLVISALDLKGVFKAIASGEEVSSGKPEPDIFLLALKRLNYNPQDCYIIEDGVSGIIAGKKIGATTIGITTSYSAEKLTNAGADYIVDSFAEMTRLLSV